MNQKENKTRVMLNLFQHLPRKVVSQRTQQTLKTLKPVQGDFMSKNGGFTLIELLVVVLIIGILAAIALPQYQKAVIKSRYATVKALTRAIADAEERYYLANNEYTNSFDNLDVHTPVSNSPSDPENKRTFNWGNCSINSKVEITCYHFGVKMEYSIRFYHSGNHRRCVARNTDLSSAQNQICKAETGKSTYSEQNTQHGYTVWIY